MFIKLCQRRSKKGTVLTCGDVNLCPVACKWNCVCLFQMEASCVLQGIKPKSTESWALNKLCFNMGLLENKHFNATSSKNSVCVYACVTFFKWGFYQQFTLVLSYIFLYIRKKKCELDISSYCLVWEVGFILLSKPQNGSVMQVSVHDSNSQITLLSVLSSDNISHLIPPAAATVCERFCTITCLLVCARKKKET